MKKENLHYQGAYACYNVLHTDTDKNLVGLPSSSFMD